LIILIITWWTVQVMKFLIMYFFSSLLLFHPSSVHIHSSAPCSQTRSVCVPPLMSDTKFHPYKITAKVIGLFRSFNWSQTVALEAVGFLSSFKQYEAHWNFNGKMLNTKIYRPNRLYLCATIFSYKSKFIWTE
jgi:hypothetical protein